MTRDYAEPRAPALALYGPPIRATSWLAGNVEL